LKDQQHNNLMNDIKSILPRWFYLFVILLFVSALTQVQGQEGQKFYGSSENPGSSGRLSIQQMQRLESCRRLTEDIDDKSLQAAIAQLDNSPDPEENLQLLEAVARTYAEIVRDQKVSGLEKKKWLYSMVTLNMAYLQLGGLDVNPPGDTSLNKLIRRKLKEHMPPELKENKNLFHPIAS
jgi:hypothetical protein